MNSNKNQNLPNLMVRCAYIDLFGACAFLCVGTDWKAMELQFVKCADAKCKKLDAESIFRDVRESVAGLNPDDIDGVTICPATDRDVPVIWMAHPTAQVLVHEITHAVSYIMRGYGLEDGEHGEVRAYMTEYLFDQFML